MTTEIANKFASSSVPKLDRCIKRSTSNVPTIGRKADVVYKLLMTFFDKRIKSADALGCVMRSVHKPVIRVIGFLLVSGSQKNMVKSSDPETRRSGRFPLNSLYRFSAAALAVKFTQVNFRHIITSLINLYLLPQ